MEALPDGFLPMLGTNFLKIVNKSILKYNLGFGFVYVTDGKVVGFVLACKDTGKLFKDIIKRKWTVLIISVLRKAIMKPSALIKIYETLYYPKKESSDEIHAELLVIAIDKDYRGRKIGKNLIDNLNAKFLQENIYKYSVSVYSDNVSANKFYKSVGLRLERSFKLYNKEFNVYVCELAKRKTE